MISCNHETGQCAIKGIGIDLLAEYATLSEQLTEAMMKSADEDAERYTSNAIASSLMSAMRADHSGCFKRAIEIAYENRNEEPGEGFPQWLKAKMASKALEDMLKDMSKGWDDDEPKEPINIAELLEKIAKEMEDGEEDIQEERSDEDMGSAMSERVRRGMGREGRSRERVYRRQ